MNEPEERQRKIARKWNEFLIRHNFKVDEEDTSVWNYTFSYLNKWILVTDYKNKISYQGILISASIERKNGELLLQDVYIIDIETNKEIRHADCMYLSKPDGEWNIEIIINQ